jgi:hypothetical protein
MVSRILELLYLDLFCDPPLNHLLCSAVPERDETMLFGFKPLSVQHPAERRRVVFASRGR